CFSNATAEPVIRVIQPYENQKIPPVTTSFVFGSVTPATATLTVNRVPVTPYKNGGFLTMIAFQEGDFKIQLVASDGVSTSTVMRSVTVDSPVKAFPTDSSKIEPIYPRT